MPTTSTTHGRTGRPPVTSRAEILTAARRLIDRDGWEKLTIRRLASDLGIGPTTLYHHIQDREDLLLLLLNDYVGQIERPPMPSDPRERIVVAAIAMHDALAAWPWAAEILTTDGFVARLDESAMWMVEAILAGASEHGCTPAQTVETFRHIWYYTAGETLVRARTARDYADKERPTFRPLDASLVPHLAATAKIWAEVAARDTYATGLRTFVDGLLARAASGAV